MFLSGLIFSSRASISNYCIFISRILFKLRLSNSSQIGMDICLAVKALHSIGVMHRYAEITSVTNRLLSCAASRDIKPANIIRTQRSSTTTFATSTASGLMSKNLSNVMKNAKASIPEKSVALEINSRASDMIKHYDAEQSDLERLSAMHTVHL